MTAFAQPSLKPFSAEYLNSFRPANANAATHESKVKMFVAENGTTRIDTGEKAIIREVGTEKAILLDHAKKEAHLIDLKPPVLPHVPTLPGVPDPAAAAPPMPPPAPPLNVTDLGKRWLDNHEVQGKRYEYPPPHPPKFPELEKIEALAEAQAPGMPKMPAAPQIPGMPQPPQAPKLPAMPKVNAPKIPDLAGAKPPPVPPLPSVPKPPPPPLPNTVMEVWTSTSLLVPMLTRTKTGYGEQISKATSVTPGPPPPSVFQVPPDYKKIIPDPAGKKLG